MGCNIVMDRVVHATSGSVKDVLRKRQRQCKCASFIGRDNILGGEREVEIYSIGILLCVNVLDWISRFEIGSFEKYVSFVEETIGQHQFGHNLKYSR